jgi:hypothetical protein
MSICREGVSVNVKVNPEYVQVIRSNIGPESVEK